MRKIKSWEKFNESDEDIFKFLDSFPKLDKSFKPRNDVKKNKESEDLEDEGRDCKACGRNIKHGFCPCGGYGEEEKNLA